jgi:Skp family chaperone for outer membrane proteins
MVRKFVAFLLVLTCAAAVEGAAPAPRMVSLDMKKLFDNFWKTRRSQLDFDTEIRGAKREENALIEQINKAEEEYKKLLENANDQALSAEEREKRKKAAEEKFSDLRRAQGALEQFRQTAQITLREKQMRIINNIVKELREQVTAKAREMGCTLVIDSSAESAASTPVFLYCNLEDITETLINELNARAPAGALEEIARKEAEAKKEAEKKPDTGPNKEEAPKK